MSEFEITTELTRKVWQQLRKGDVPGVGRYEESGLVDWVESINKELSIHSYMPSVVHGYLGIEKNLGVTRFIPLLTKEDMSIYYHICGALGSSVIRDVPNIYGGWRSIPSMPTMVRNNPWEAAARHYDQNYYSTQFSSAAWFQQFRNFNEALRDLVGNGNIGNYVVKTDIANFYDSIDVGNLIRKLRKDTPKLTEHINLLELFLGCWNRRTSGYQTSSRGIPQEIISDGSRNLSHYYLQDFDAKFIEYCEARGLVYLRWADDILVFGSSRKALETAVHNASKLLLADGLNLNASKTNIFSRRDF